MARIRAISDDLDAGIAAGLAAGAVVQEFYDGETAATYAKGDGSPVTDADLAADRAIRDVLTESFSQRRHSQRGRSE